MRMKVAVAQMCSVPSLAENMEVCGRLVEEAARAGARWVAFPENAPFLGLETDKLPIAEALDGPIVGAFKALARRHGLGILLGSTAETGPDPGRVYNTSVLIDSSGKLLADYRKIHLFDVELPDGKTLMESEAVAPGEDVVLADFDGVKVGLTICYDLRFPEIYRMLRARGAQVLCVPAAFTERTGRDHWEVLLRARAIENQSYVLAPGQWGEHFKGRRSYGRSMIIDPWGTILAQVPDGVGVALAEIDTDAVDEVRRRMPCLSHSKLLE